MKAQFMEGSIATTREGSSGCGRMLLLSLPLILAACTSLPSGPEAATEGEGRAGNESTVNVAPVITAGSSPAQADPASPYLTPEQLAPVAAATAKPVAYTPVAPKPVAPKPVAPKPVAPKPVANNQLTIKTRVTKRVFASPKVESEPHPQVVPLEQPPIKALDKKKTAARKPKRRLPVKTDRVRVGDSQIEMVRLPGGVFQMGSSDGDYDERPLHEVALRPFSIGRYEVTQQQWMSVMGENPSYFKDCAECPVDSVSWADIQKFLIKLNQLSDRRFRLPSEAEWEYACRAGEQDAYCGDGDETLIGWYLENSGGRSQPVGGLASNAFGLYDMSGNAYEWVEDCWHSGYGEAPGDGSAWSDGNCLRRVLRGGAWYYTPAYATATYRNANMPYSRFIIYGFRLAHDSK